MASGGKNFFTGTRTPRSSVADAFRAHTVTPRAADAAPNWIRDRRFSSQTTLFLPERVSRLRLTYSWDVLNHGHLERQLLLESEDDLCRFRIAQVNRSCDDLT